MAERIVPEAGVRPTASPVDRYVSPVLKQAPTSNGWLDAAAALQTLNPSLQKFLQNRNADNAATAEAQGMLAEQGVAADIAFQQGRDSWRKMISEVRKTDPVTAEKMVGANPHFRRGMVKAKMNRIGMALNDHLMNLWRENPMIDGVPLHDVDDPAVISQWMQNATTEYTQRYGVENMDPLLVADVYGKRVQAAQDQMMSRHTEFRLNRYNEEYLQEMSANTGMILSGGGTNASDTDEFLNRLGMSENSGKWGGTNDLGYTGKFQVGEGRLADYNRANGTSLKLSDLNDTPEGRKAQMAVARWHIGDIDKTIAKYGFLDKGYSLDGLRAVAHLGGIGGMIKFVRTGGEYNPDDGYTRKDGTKVKGTKLSDYYAKFSGPGAQLQETLDNAINDGMNPTKANKTIVDGIILTALTTGNPAVLDTLNDIQSGSGPLGNVGWVKEAVLSAKEKISASNWQADQQQYTLDQREHKAKVAEMQTAATRAILADPFGVDIEQLQKSALDLGEADIATGLGTLKEQLIDRDYNVRPNHERIAELRMAISTGSMEDDEFLKSIREEVGINFSSAVASQLMDDFDNKDRYRDLYSDRQVQGIVSDLGRVISERFAVSNGLDRIPGTEKGVEAERYLSRNLMDYIRENPEASQTEVREYADKQLEKMLKSPVWQPTQEESFGQPPRPYGEVTGVAQDLTRLTTEPANTLAEWLSKEMTPTQTNLINIAAQSMGMTAQEFITRYGARPQGN